MQLYLDNFHKHKKNGLEAYRNGDLEMAKSNLLQAAHYLFLLAQKSQGTLRENRKKNASKLKEMALNIKKRVYSEIDESSENASFQTIKPETLCFKDIAGLENIKENILVRMVYPFQYPELAKSYDIKRGGGLLLYGPPGTGKTLIARAVAAEIQADFFTVKPSEIMSKLVGEAEKNISQLFEQARSVHRAVIFIDEVESLTPARSSENSPVMQRLVPQILQELEGIHTNKSNLLFIGATNEPWSIDSAMLRPGRFDELLYVHLPNEEARTIIFQKNLEKRPLADDIDYKKLAELTPGFSGADIVGICQRTANAMFLEAIMEEKRAINLEDILKILLETRPSVSKEQVKLFDAFFQEN